jgi:hypothetical protein
MLYPEKIYQAKECRRKRRERPTGQNLKRNLYAIMRDMVE